MLSAFLFQFPLKTSSISCCCFLLLISSPFQCSAPPQAPFLAGIQEVGVAQDSVKNFFLHVIDNPLSLSQSTNNLWFHAKSARMTSTSFKRICSRRADHEKLATSLKSAASVQTKAMKRGVEQEPIAATQYT